MENKRLEDLFKKSSIHEILIKFGFVHITNISEDFTIQEKEYFKHYQEIEGNIILLISEQGLIFLTSFLDDSEKIKKKFFLEKWKFSLIKEPETIPIVVSGELQKIIQRMKNPCI